MRRLIAFACAGETLIGTLDAAPGETGLLIVSGGNEIRAGAHRGMAQLAREVAEAGLPVFRFDRRGVGDSSGENRGYSQSREDIAAAIAAFRENAPALRRIIGFGNCDAATALALFHDRLGLDAIILANPWVVEAPADLPPPAAIRAHYVRRLASPAAWARLVRGKIDFRKFFRGLKAISSNISEESRLADRVARALNGSTTPRTLLLARRDHTATAFAAEWHRPAFAPARARARLHMLDSGSHSFASTDEHAWLRARIIAALSE